MSKRLYNIRISKICKRLDNIGIFSNRRDIRSHLDDHASKTLDMRDVNKLLKASTES